MFQAENSLKQIPFESLEILRDSYKVDWPNHVVAFNFIDNMIRRFKKHPEHREIVKIYSINGIIEADATFIALMHDKEIIFDTLDSSLEKLRETLKLMDFSKHRHFMCTKNIYHNFVLDFIAAEDKNILGNDETIMMYLSKEDAMKFEYEIPDGLQIRPLSCEDAYKVNSNWAHASPGSEKFIEYNIKFNENVGLYDENNELLSWCLSHDFTLLLNLFTVPNHLRKGYAGIVTKAISKKLAINCDITASIIVKNVKSLNLFKKLGFKEIDRNWWIGVESK